MAFVFVWLQTPRLIKPLCESRTTGVFVHIGSGGQRAAGA